MLHELSKSFRLYSEFRAKEYLPYDGTEKAYLRSARALFNDLSAEIKRLAEQFPELKNLKFELADIAWNTLEKFRKIYKK